MLMLISMMIAALDVNRPLPFLYFKRLVVSNHTSRLPPQLTCLQTILNKLSADELEYIAQSSFAYWSACQSDEITDRDDMRHGMAMREVARYYDAAKEDEQLVLEALKKTCQYRKEYRIDILRFCFDVNSVVQNCDEQQELAERYRTVISEDLAKQPMVVKSGPTGRGVLEIGARSCTNTDMNDKDFVLTVIYMIERTLAATESQSRGTETMMDVVLDASCCSKKYAPSRSALKTLAGILQNQYPQRLNTLVILDPPFWLSTLYSMASPMLDSRTRKKFQLARGSKAKKSALLATVLQFPTAGEEPEDAVRVVRTTPFQIPIDSSSLNKGSARVLSQ